nr:MAG TPA: hypothetical protein [Caudoviricetes sp.]
MNMLSTNQPFNRQNQPNSCDHTFLINIEFKYHFKTSQIHSHI